MSRPKGVAQVIDDTRPNVGHHRSEVDLDQLTSREPPVIDIVLGKIQFEALYEQLPDKVHRTIFKMRHEGYSVKEIARRLGVVERTVERKVAMIQFFYEELNPAIDFSPFHSSNPSRFSGAGSRR